MKSPRARRRLAWLGVLVLAGVATGIVFALLPNEKGGFKGPRSTGTVQVVTTERQVPLTARDRREIDALFDRFVPAAVSRLDPAAAYDLVTHTLTAGTTRAQWATGQIPVSPFKAGGTQFHGWTVVTSYANSATLDLTLQPRDPRDGPGAFTVYLERVKGRWLIDEFYRRTAYAPTKTQPAATKTATTHRAPPGTKGRLGVGWLLLPLAFLSLILIVPAVIFSSSWFADRRVARRYRDQLPKELPPLPRPRDQERTPGGGT